MRRREHPVRQRAESERVRIPITAATASHDGLQVVFGDAQGRVWGRAVGAVGRPVLHLEASQPPRGGVTAIVCLDPVGAESCVGFEYGSIACLQGAGQPVLVLEHGGGGAVRQMSWEGGERLLLVVSDDGVVVWERTQESWRRIKILEASSSPAFRIIGASFVGPCRVGLITSQNDDAIGLWRTGRGTGTAWKPSGRLTAASSTGEHCSIRCFSSSPDGSLVVAAAVQAPQLWLWETASFALLAAVGLASGGGCLHQVIVTSRSQLYCLGSEGVLTGMGVAQQGRSGGSSTWANLRMPMEGLGQEEERMASVAIAGGLLAAISEDGKLSLHHLPALEQTESTTVQQSLRKGATEARVQKLGTEEGGAVDVASLSVTKLRLVLKQQGQFPKDLRLTAWRSLLGLPRNAQAFARLVAKGTHPAYRHLNKRYPLCNRKLMVKLTAACSALAHWSEVMAKASHVPTVVFPFVALFGSDDLGAFEAAMTVLLHWGSHWLVTFPQPPIPTMSMVRAMVKQRNPSLVRHLDALRLGPETYAWGVLRSLFTEVLSGEDWQVLMDHTVAAADDVFFLTAAAAALVLLNRRGLLAAASHDEAEAMFHSQQPGRVEELVALARTIREEPSGVDGCGRASVMEEIAAIEAAVHSVLGSIKVGTRCALPVGEYPCFDGLPQLLENYQIRERERIAAEVEQEQLREDLVTKLSLRAAQLKDQGAMG